MNKPTLSPTIANLLMLFEKYVLSFIFLLFAFTHLAQLFGAPPPISDGLQVQIFGWELSRLVNHILLTIFGCLVGFFMLFNRRPEKLPDSWREVLIPLAATYFALGYNLNSYVPEVLSQNIVPNQHLASIAVIAFFISAFGYCFSSWGISYLGRSFAIMVAVRKVVCQGPYRFVRHPIYFGYFFEITGLTLAHLSIFNIMITIAGICLVIYRARLEERKLARHDDTYRIYMQQTGFLFPKLTNSWPPIAH